MSATPWVRAMSVGDAAERLHVGMAHVAEWVVSGRLRARVQLGAQRVNVYTVLVSEKDVRERLKRPMTPVPVEDTMADEIRANELLRRRRSSTGWLVDWQPPRRPGGHPSTRRMGVTPDDRVREVRAAVSKLGGRNGWVRLSAVTQKMGNRAWVSSAVVRDIVDVLVAEGVLAERLFRPNVGRPSPEIRFTDKES